MLSKKHSFSRKKCSQPIHEVIWDQLWAREVKWTENSCSVGLFNSFVGATHVNSAQQLHVNDDNATSFAVFVSSCDTGSLCCLYPSAAYFLGLLSVCSICVVPEVSSSCGSTEWLGCVSVTKTETS